MWNRWLDKRLFDCDSWLSWSTDTGGVPRSILWQVHDPQYISGLSVTTASTADMIRLTIWDALFLLWMGIFFFELKLYDWEEKSDKDCPNIECRVKNTINVWTDFVRFVFILQVSWYQHPHPSVSAGTWRGCVLPPFVIPRGETITISFHAVIRYTIRFLLYQYKTIHAIHTGFLTIWLKYVYHDMYCIVSWPSCIVSPHYPLSKVLGRV